MTTPKKPVAHRAPKVMDVAHPGTSRPSTSGKPVIVTNRPILHDPMTLEVPVAAVGPTTAPELVSHNVTVKPPGDASEPTIGSQAKSVNSGKTLGQLAEEAKARAEEAKVKKAEAEAPKEKPVGEPEPEPAPKVEAAETKIESEPESEAPESKEEPAEANSDTTTPGAKAIADEEAKLAEAEKHDAELEKLAESKEYFLPINAVEKRKTKRFVVLGVVLSVVLAIAWVDIALDAGLLQLGSVKPVTHFFSN